MSTTLKLDETGFNIYSEKVYSQYGEDGIIAKVLEYLPCDKWCVEFGAHDGIQLSNTCNLIRNQNYKSVLIEPNTKKFNRLRENVSNYEAILIKKFVSYDGANKLDSLLQQTPIPLQFDFLSIDIDGCDYHILDSLKVYKPKLICIEYNPSIPNVVHFVQSRDFSVKQGSSAKAILELARSKGYELIGVTYCNLLLIDKTFLPNIGLEKGFDLDELRDDSDSIIHVFSGFDGTIMTDKPVTLFWHEGIVIDKNQLQALPKLLRQYPADYNFIKQIFYGLYLLVKNPESLIRLLKHRFSGK